MKWLGRWFWAPVKLNENSAQTLVRVLGNIFRSIVTVAFVLGVVGAAALINASSISSAEYAEERKERERILASVTRVENQDTRIENERLIAGLRAAHAAGDETTARRFANAIRDLRRDPEMAQQLCTSEYPISIYVENNSSKALQSMTVELVARKRGSSTNELDYGDREIEWDKIVPPGHAMVMRYNVSAEQDSLQFSGAPRDYTIELVPLEDWMLKESQAWEK
jgi:hypothetical protein